MRSVFTKKNDLGRPESNEDEMKRTSVDFKPIKNQGYNIGSELSKILMGISNHLQHSDKDDNTGSLDKLNYQRPESTRI